MSGTNTDQMRTDDGKKGTNEQREGSASLQKKPGGLGVGLPNEGLADRVENDRPEKEDRGD